MLRLKGLFASQEEKRGIDLELWKTKEISNHHYNPNHQEHFEITFGPWLMIIIQGFIGKQSSPPISSLTLR